MHTGKGRVLEWILQDERRHVRIRCAPDLIPSPGRYLLAGDGSVESLPAPLFYTESAPEGFIATGLFWESWTPGVELYLRGPLGRGFSLPASARRVGMIALDGSARHMKGLIRPALAQEAAVVLVCDSPPDTLPVDLEVQPMSALLEILEWADYLAFDVRRDNLNQLRERLRKLHHFAAARHAQVLVHAPVPCGGMAECGVCAVPVGSGWRLACKDGPVFDWWDLE